MATFVGHISSSTKQTKGNHRSTNLNSQVQNQARYRTWPVGFSPNTNGRTLVGPVEVKHRQNLKGALYAHFLKMIYFRIHISTLNIDVGSVVSTQQVLVSVWNSYFDERALTDITALFDEGVTVEGPEPPEWFGALEDVTYTLVIGVNGPPTIETEITWSFGSESVTVVLAGLRISFWSFWPTWEGGIRERLEWYTSILSGPLGTEQRRAMRLAPRRSFDLQLIARPEERAFLELLLFNWGGRNWAIPIWPDVQEMQQPLTAGDTFIPCSTVGRDFTAGGLVALRGASAYSYEMVQVESVAVNGVTLRRPLLQSWPVATRLYPARVAQFSEQPTATRLTDQATSVNAKFRIIEPCDWPEVAPALQYRGIPAYLDRPEESQDLTSTYVRLLELMDNKLDNVRVYDSAGIGFVAQSHRWQMHGRQQQTAMRSLWYYLRGQARAVWIPTHFEDLLLYSEVLQNSIVINVKFTGYTKYGQMQPGKRDILITLRDGTQIMRRITGAVDKGEYEELSIDASLGLTYALQPSAVLRISYMALCRMDQDFIELTHETDSDGLALANGTWRSLRDDLGAAV